ncbi:MAG: hypothetical protein Q9180_004183, partial [Flavoplaca navasiana]
NLSQQNTVYIPTTEETYPVLPVDTQHRTQRTHKPKDPLPKMQLPIKSSHPSPHPQQGQLSLPGHSPHAPNQPESSTPRQPNTILPQPPTHGTPVYIPRLLEGWRRTATAPVMKVEILGVFLDVEVANEYTRKVLQVRLPGRQYRYGEGEVVKADGGIQVDLMTGKRDGSLLVDVERHVVEGG